MTGVFDLLVGHEAVPSLPLLDDGEILEVYEEMNLEKSYLH